MLFGSIAARKGVTELVAALEHSKLARSVTFAGLVNPSFRSEFDAAIARLDGGGIEVDIMDRWISDAEAAQQLASANLAALPYPRHFGMSRVLLEAAAAGTPVVGNNFGLMAEQIREYRLGEAVDIRDAAVFGGAIDDVIARGARIPAEVSSRFVSRYSASAYEATLANTWSIDLCD